MGFSLIYWANMLKTLRCFKVYLWSCIKHSCLFFRISRIFQVRPFKSVKITEIFFIKKLEGIISMFKIISPQKLSQFNGIFCITFLLALCYFFKICTTSRNNLYITILFGRTYLEIYFALKQQVWKYKKRVTMMKGCIHQSLSSLCSVFLYVR